ncbi:MAG TPA: M3 family metallopeptidase, partial [Gemmatimonadaceae bacterium]|nr:M3 family metallopeptidase [Gemmatimonadaceae bacterium]
MKSSRFLSLVGVVAFVGACAAPVQAPVATTPSTSVSLPASNPFAAPSTLPFQAPDFTKIHDADYEPAFIAGMAQQLAEVAAIANQTAAPTFDNTIIPLEKSGEILTRVSKVFNAITGANTNDTLQAIQERLSPKLAQHSDAIFLDGKLYQRVKSIFDKRNELGLDQQQKSLVELYNRNFVRAGANLSDTSKEALKKLNQEEASLQTDFQNRLLAATKAGALVIDDVKQLDGFGPSEIAAAEAAAKQRGLTGKWVIPLQNTTQHPAQASLKNRSVREKLFMASTMRAEHNDSNDTRNDVKRLAELRAEKAKLLGFPTYSAYALDNQMAKNPENAIKLLTNLVPASVARAHTEIADMQKLIDSENGGFKLAPWDYQYYAEQVRKQRYAMDESQLKPYFEINRVLEDGVFFAANKLYGLTFKERKDIPVYHPDVRVFEVFDADGKSLALFYADYWKRDEKGGGAWMDNFV